MRFFVREALQSVRRNKVPSFAAAASILVTVLVLGIFIPITQAATGAANEVRGKVQVNVYLTPRAGAEDVKRVQERLTQDTKYVGDVQYVSKAQAYAEQKKKYPEYYDALLGANPLPDTFRVTPDKPDDALKLVDALSPRTASGERASVDPAIASVKNKKDDTQRILFITKIIKWGVGVLAVLLVLASALLIANTIRLSLYARRREVEVMKLVGATDWFIRWPFVFEGILLGTLGGVGAVTVLLIGKVAFFDPLVDGFPLLAAPETMTFGVLVVVLLFASVAVSAAGSGLSLRKFLRV